MKNSAVSAKQEDFESDTATLEVAGTATPVAPSDGTASGGPEGQDGGQTGTASDRADGQDAPTMKRKAMKGRGKGGTKVLGNSAMTKAKKMAQTKGSKAVTSAPASGSPGKAVAKTASASTKEAPAKAAGKASGKGKHAKLPAVSAKGESGPTPKSKPAAATTEEEKEDGGEFKQLSRRAKINRFGRSLVPRAKRLAGDKDKAKKAPPEVLEECTDPKRYKVWLDRYVGSETGDWAEIYAKETLTESTESTKNKERNWMFPFQMMKKFGAHVAKAYQESLAELQDESGETDNDKKDYVRIHPDMKNQKPKISTQYNILALDASASQEKKKRAIEVETTINCSEGIPSGLSRSDLPSGSLSASSVGVKGPKVMTIEEKKKRQEEKDKREADRKRSEAIPMNQAIKFLKDMKEIPDLKTALVELSAKEVTQYVPESQRKEWTDTFKKYIQELGDIRSSMEERIAVNNPKLFDIGGGKPALEDAKTLAAKAALNLKAWKSTYNVYLNANSPAAQKKKTMK